MHSAHRALQDAIVATHTLPPAERKAFAADLQKLAGYIDKTEHRFAKCSKPRFWWGSDRYVKWKDERLEIREVFLQAVRKLECLMQSRSSRLDEIALFLDEARGLYEALRPYIKLDAHIEELHQLEQALGAVRREVQDGTLTLWDSFGRIASLENAAGRLSLKISAVETLMEHPDVDFGFTTNRAKLIRGDLMRLLEMVDQLDEAARAFKPRLRFDGRTTPEELQRQFESYDALRCCIEEHLHRNVFIRNAIAHLPASTADF